MSDTQKPLNDAVSPTAKQTTSQKIDSKPGPGGGGVKVPPPPKCNCNTNEKEKNSRKWWGTISAAFPFWVSIISLVISFLAYQNTGRSAAAAKQSANAATQSVSIARRSLEVSTRPWINISGTKLQSDVAPGVPVPFKTCLTNVGKTPAQNVTAYFAIETSTKCVCSPSNQRETFGSLAPGGKRTITADMTARTSDIIEQVKQGNLTINLCVEILYEDGFSKHRRTTTNLYARPGEDRKFYICPSGNIME